MNQSICNPSAVSGLSNILAKTMMQWNQEYTLFRGKNILFQGEQIE
jgi:hypothetical protein